MGQNLTHIYIWYFLSKYAILSQSSFYFHDFGTYVGNKFCRNLHTFSANFLSWKEQFTTNILAFRMFELLVQRALLVVRSRVIGGNILLHQPLQRTISLHQTHLMAHEDQHHNNSGWKFEDWKAIFIPFCCVVSFLVELRQHYRFSICSFFVDLANTEPAAVTPWERLQNIRRASINQKLLLVRTKLINQPRHQRQDRWMIL